MTRDSQITKWRHELEWCFTFNTTVLLILDISQPVFSEHG